MGQSFGRYLRSLREDREMTLRQVEEKTGISNAYLSQVERGARGTPGWKMLQRLATAYGVPIQELVNAAESEHLGRSMPKQEPTTPDAQFIAAQYQKLSEKGKRELKGFLQYLVDKERRLMRAVLK